MKTSNKSVLTDELLMNKIYYFRAQKVMLDKDFAELYNAKTKQLKRQVNRNIDRFPIDFMFELTHEDFENFGAQIGISSWGGARYLPTALDKQGVAMLSSVLNSKQAINVNIQIIRVFTSIGEMLLTHLSISYKQLLIFGKYIKSNTSKKSFHPPILEILIQKDQIASS